MKILSKLDGADKLKQDSNNRFVTDAEKLAWNSKPDTDTVTTINGKTGAISKADILALGINDGAIVDLGTFNNQEELITHAIMNQLPTGHYTFIMDSYPYFMLLREEVDYYTGTFQDSEGITVNFQVMKTGEIVSLDELDIFESITDLSDFKADKTYVDSKVQTDVPSGAKFTDTVTTINGKTGAISKADIVALGIPAQDTNTTYSEITTAEIDAGTASTLRTMTGRRVKYILDKVQGWIADVPTGKKVARFVIGTSTAGWTAADCDYLCDGTADQTEINNAITALPATGGEIVILDGTYNITAKIDVTKDNVSIKGNGNATILKRMYDSTGDEGLITLISRSGCKITNLQVDGNYNYGLDLFLHNSNNNTITGNTCNNSGDLGILLRNSSSNIVTGNTCDNNRNNLFLYDSNNNTITGNTCNNSSEFGIFLYNSNNNTITGNTCNNSSASGIYLEYSSNNAVTGNICIRGTGLATDYTTNQHTIQLSGAGNNYNLISNNNCMGKAVTNQGGTGNTIIDNKWSNSPGRILEGYSEKLVTLSGTSTAINLSLGNVFVHTPSGNRTYSITNAVSGQAHSFTLIINMGSTVRTLTFPASVKWQGGETPDMTTANKTYVLTFMSVNGGTTWLGMFGGEF